MSTLRQKRKDQVSKEDIESLISPPDVDVDYSPDDDDVEYSVPGSSSSSYSSKPSSSSAASHHLLHQNPVVVARMVLRKVGQLLTTSSDDNNNNEDADADADEAKEGITAAVGFVYCLREILIGIILAIFCISVLMVLDHKDVIHLQSAHNYRDFANMILSDPETMKSVEESSGMRMMTLDDYNDKIKEIETFPIKIIESREKMKKYIPDMEAAMKEYDAVKRDYDMIVSEPLLSVTEFCGECGWHGRTNCDARMNYYVSNYGLKTIPAKLAIMEQSPQCVKKV